MANKDPAFLFYPKDWLQGTSTLMPDEKGVYIDLLANQHQINALPNDTKRLARMVGLSESDFLPIWETLKTKFIETNDNRLVNRRLTEVVTERRTKGDMNRVTGTFASIIRLSNLDEQQRQKIKKEFKPADFLTVPSEDLTNRLTVWFQERLKSIANGNGNGNAIYKGGMGEKIIDSAYKISEDGNLAYFNDGTWQKLGMEQRTLIKSGEWQARDIKRGSTF